MACILSMVNIYKYLLVLYVTLLYMCNQTNRLVSGARIESRKNINTPNSLSLWLLWGLWVLIFDLFWLLMYLLYWLFICEHGYLFYQGTS